MDDRRLGRAVRARRHRRGWRLEDLAARAGVGRTACSLLERGQLDRLTVRTARRIAAAVDLRLEWDIGWQRQEVDRLLDADHAALLAHLSARLTVRGWLTRPEVSFNRYGDRGRIDLVAWAPGPRCLLVVEAKTTVVDAQDLLGRLDIKARVARGVAAELGWDARVVVPAIVVMEGTTARRRLRSIAPLLTRYALRGHAAVAWLRRPIGDPSGVLLLVKLPPSAHSDRRRAGRRRVRVRTSVPRSREAAKRPPAGSEGA